MTGQRHASLPIVRSMGSRQPIKTLGASRCHQSEAQNDTYLPGPTREVVNRNTRMFHNSVRLAPSLLRFSAYFQEI
jgi:hypothetical protein